MQKRDQYNNINQQKISIIERIKEKIAIIGFGLLTVVILIGAVLFLSRDSATIDVPDSEIVTKAGLHWHPNLIIKIDGKKQELPANIGLAGSVHQKIHTHDTDAKDGVVHIEAQGVVAKSDIRLSNFFRIWGKEFSSTQILDSKNTSEKSVKMKVNGKENKEFGSYQMKDGDKIEISY